MDSENIDLSKVYYPWKLRLVLFGLKMGLICGAFVAFSWISSHAWNQIRSEYELRSAQAKYWLLNTFRLQEAQATEEKREESTKQLIDRIAREEGVSPVLVLAMAYQESSIRLDADATRFEDWVWRKYRLSDNTAGRLQASSIGLMQVIPVYHVGKGKSCEGIIQRAGELFDREKNIRCGIAALKQCLAKNKGDFRRALVCFNGGEEYSKIVTGNLANLAVSEFHLLPEIG